LSRPSESENGPTFSEIRRQTAISAANAAAAAAATSREERET